MDGYSITAIIVTLVFAISYINHRFIKMQPTIAIMSGSLSLSLLFILADNLGFHSVEKNVTSMLGNLDFHHLLMDGILSFLLFAGALTVNINELREQKWMIATLASFSTVASALFISIVMYYLLPFLGIQLPFVFCFLFGALISPTDPIAVLAIFKSLNAPKQLNITVSGESLFNDGVGIVLFIVISQVAFDSQTTLSFSNVAFLFLQQAVGGIFYGIALGLLAYGLIKSIDDHKVEILATLAIVTGGYSLAHTLGISGPLAMVVAGIFIGNKGRQFSMSQKTRESLDNFWELIDEILNAVLFLLIGFELILVSTQHQALIAALLAIPVALIARSITVAIPIQLFFRKKIKKLPYFKTILVWGGLRGGLAVALALALPPSDSRSLILAMTYGVVIFSIIVQGGTSQSLLRLQKRKMKSRE